MLAWLLRAIAWLAVIALVGIGLLSASLMDPLSIGLGLACLIAAAIIYVGFLHRPRASVVITHGGHSSAEPRQVKREVRVVAVRQPLGGLEVEEAVLRRLRPRGEVPVVFVESGRFFARAIAGVRLPDDVDLHQAFEVLGSLGARLYVTPEAKLAFCVKDLKAWSDKEAAAGEVLAQANHVAYSLHGKVLSLRELVEELDLLTSLG